MLRTLAGVRRARAVARRGWLVDIALGFAQTRRCGRDHAWPPQVHRRLRMLHLIRMRQLRCVGRTLATAAVRAVAVPFARLHCRAVPRDRRPHSEWVRLGPTPLSGGHIISSLKLKLAVCAGMDVRAMRRRSGASRAAHGETRRAPRRAAAGTAGCRAQALH